METITAGPSPDRTDPPQNTSDEPGNRPIDESWRDYASALGLFAVTAVFSLVFHIRVPYKDQWSIVPAIAKFEAGTLSLERFFALHGSHWHSSGYLVMLINARLTAMTLWVEIVVSLAAAAFGFAGLAQALRHTPYAIDGPSGRRLTLAAAAFFHFSIDQGVNWIWSWQVAVHLSTAGCLWAIALLAKPGLSTRAVAMAATGATIALYGFATAWAIWPIGLVLIAVCPDTTLRRRAIVALVWLGLTSMYLTHFRSVQNVEYTTRVMPTEMNRSSIAALADYVITYMGAGLATQIPSLITPVAVGGGVLLVLSVAVLNGMQTQPIEAVRTFRVPLALAAYGVGSAVLTGLGRWSLGPLQATSARYITFSNYFWIAAVVLLIAIARTKARPIRVLPTALLVAVLALKLLNLTGARVAVNNAVAANRAACNLALEYPTTEASWTSEVSARNQPIEDWLAILHDLELNIFSGEGPRQCGSAHPRAVSGNASRDAESW